MGRLNGYLMDLIKSCWTRSSASMSSDVSYHHAHFHSSMASSCVATVIAIICAKVSADELCTDQWGLSVEGVDPSQLTVHHSSTFMPDLFTHLVWQWRGPNKLSGTLWVSQHRHRGKFDGGFIAQPRSLFQVPASVVWTLVNGTLGVTTHGHSSELASYPSWGVTVCDNRLAWGITGEKELYVTYDGVNESRSLDESWAVEHIRSKRQAEFPVEPEGELPPIPPTDTTTRNWWRRFLDSIGFSSDGDRARSWIWDLTETLFKFIFAAANQRSPSNIPTNPEAEMIPSGQQRDIKPLTDGTLTPGNVPSLFS